MKVILPFLMILSIFVFCNKQDQKNDLVQIGSSKLNRDQFESYGKILRMYPSQLNPYFPGQRPTVSGMVETEAIYSKAKWDFSKGGIRSSADWKWKKMYYPAQVFMMEPVYKNLGFTDKEIEQYYKTHLDSFKTVAKTDSTKKDTTVYRQLSEVSNEISELLFLQKYQPDSAFLARYGDSIPDSETLNSDWLQAVKGNLLDFLMRKYYKAKYNKAYPDSINEIFGKGKIITPEDMDVIMTWVPQERKDFYNNPQGKKELVEWLLKWKLFSEKAKESGFTSDPAVKILMDWAWKIEVTNEYVKNRLIPVATASATIDSDMVLYSIYDANGVRETKPDSLFVKSKIEELINEETGSKIDSIIYNIRKKVGVKFLQNDIKDEKDVNPVTLMSHADSLRDTGNVDEAERIYNTLSTDFKFSPEGKNALVELAKIQTERQLYDQAVKNYRKYLLSGVDQTRRCNTFFMIGFIYDEYLDQPELAEVNYKWVLKNAPDCELADDAEFMMLHLSEPMSSVEELQAEALRQGRKVEPLEEDTLEMDSEVAKTL